MVELFRPLKNTKKNQIVKKNLHITRFAKVNYKNHLILGRRWSC